MDWLTFIVSIIKALAWPGVVLAAFVVLRQQVSILISELGSRLVSAKGAGVELSFAARIDEVQKTLSKDELVQLASSTESKQAERISDLSGKPPAYIISQAWLRVETEIRRSVTMWLVTTTPGLADSPVFLLRTAMKHKFITEEEFKTLNQLRQLRNQAIHSLNMEITLTDALRYNDIADSLIQQIRERSETKRDRSEE